MIGNFFVKIGLGIKKGFFAVINWIKNTAWIQPLLIVGVIFGVILSIKPVTNWISGLMNPDESYYFYKNHDTKNLFTGDQIETFIKANKGDAVIVYYSDTDSTAKDMEKQVRRVADSTSYKWYCVNINVDKEDAAYDDRQHFDVDYYNDMYPDFVRDYKNIFTESSADTFSNKVNENSIPNPMFIRLSDDKILGIKFDFESEKELDLRRFLSTNYQTDWKLTWTDYKNKAN